MSESVFKINSLGELDELLLTEKKHFTFVGGATDLMVNPVRWESSGNFIDLSGVEGLSDRIELSGDSLLIGAAVPFSKIIRSELIRNYFPILADACSQIGSVQIQNRATIGGNIANSSPAGDSMPVLSVLNAELLTGPRENDEFKIKRIDEVMLGPGENSLKGNKYIAYVRIPLPDRQNYFWYFRKVGQRYSMAISKLSLAIKAVKEEDEIRDIAVCAGSVSPQIKRAGKTESQLTGKSLDAELIERAKKVFLEEISPISDIRSTKDYRKEISGEILREALYLLKDFRD